MNNFKQKNIIYSIQKYNNLPNDRITDVGLNANQTLYTGLNHSFNKLINNDLFIEKRLSTIDISSFGPKVLDLSDYNEYISCLNNEIPVITSNYKLKNIITEETPLNQKYWIISTEIENDSNISVFNNYYQDLSSTLRDINLNLEDKKQIELFNKFYIYNDDFNDTLSVQELVFNVQKNDYDFKQINFNLGLTGSKVKILDVFKNKTNDKLKNFEFLLVQVKNENNEQINKLIQLNGSIYSYKILEIKDYEQNSINYINISDFIVFSEDDIVYVVIKSEFDDLEPKLYFGELVTNNNFFDDHIKIYKEIEIEEETSINLKNSKLFILNNKPYLFSNKEIYEINIVEINTTYNTFIKANIDNISSFSGTFSQLIEINNNIYVIMSNTLYHLSINNDGSLLAISLAENVSYINQINNDILIVCKNQIYYTNLENINNSQNYKCILNVDDLNLLYANIKNIEFNNQSYKLVYTVDNKSNYLYYQIKDNLNNTNYSTYIYDNFNSLITNPTTDLFNTTIINRWLRKEISKDNTIEYVINDSFKKDSINYLLTNNGLITYNETNVDNINILSNQYTYLKTDIQQQELATLSNIVYEYNDNYLTAYIIKNANNNHKLLYINSNSQRGVIDDSNLIDENTHIIYTNNAHYLYCKNYIFKFTNLNLNIIKNNDDTFATPHLDNTDLLISAFYVLDDKIVYAVNNNQKYNIKYKNFDSTDKIEITINDSNPLIDTNITINNYEQLIDVYENSFLATNKYYKFRLQEINSINHEKINSSDYTAKIRDLLCNSNNKIDWNSGTTTINNIIKDEQNNLYIITNNGLYRYFSDLKNNGFNTTTFNGIDVNTYLKYLNFYPMLNVNNISTFCDRVTLDGSSHLYSIGKKLFTTESNNEFYSSYLVGDIINAYYSSISSISTIAALDSLSKSSSFVELTNNFESSQEIPINFNSNIVAIDYYRKNNSNVNSFINKNIYGSVTFVALNNELYYQNPTEQFDNFIKDYFKIDSDNYKYYFGYDIDDETYGMKEPTNTFLSSLSSMSGLSILHIFNYIYNNSMYCDVLMENNYNKIFAFTNNTNIAGDLSKYYYQTSFDLSSNPYPNENLTEFLSDGLLKCSSTVLGNLSESQFNASTYDGSLVVMLNSENTLKIANNIFLTSTTINKDISNVNNFNLNKVVEVVENEVDGVKEYLTYVKDYLTYITNTNKIYVIDCSDINTNKINYQFTENDENIINAIYCNNKIYIESYTVTSQSVNTTQYTITLKCYDIESKSLSTLISLAPTTTLNIDYNNLNIYNNSIVFYKAPDNKLYYSNSSNSIIDTKLTCNKFYINNDELITINNGTLKRYTINLNDNNPTFNSNDTPTNYNSVTDVYLLNNVNNIYPDNTIIINNNSEFSINTYSFVDIQDNFIKYEYNETYNNNISFVNLIEFKRFNFILEVEDQFIPYSAFLLLTKNSLDCIYSSNLNFNNVNNNKNINKFSIITANENEEFQSFDFDNLNNIYVKSKLKIYKIKFNHLKLDENNLLVENDENDENEQITEYYYENEDLSKLNKVTIFNNSYNDNINGLQNFTYIYQTGNENNLSTEISAQINFTDITYKDIINEYNELSNITGNKYKRIDNNIYYINTSNINKIYLNNDNQITNLTIFTTPAQLEIKSFKSYLINNINQYFINFNNDTISCYNFSDNVLENNNNAITIFNNNIISVINDNSELTSTSFSSFKQLYAFDKLYYYIDDNSYNENTVKIDFITSELSVELNSILSGKNYTSLENFNSKYYLNSYDNDVYGVYEFNYDTLTVNSSKVTLNEFPINDDSSSNSEYIKWIYTTENQTYINSNNNIYLNNINSRNPLLFEYAENLSKIQNSNIIFDIPNSGNKKFVIDNSGISSINPQKITNEVGYDYNNDILDSDNKVLVITDIDNELTNNQSIQSVLNIDLSTTILILNNTGLVQLNQNLMDSKINTSLNNIKQINYFNSVNSYAYLDSNNTIYTLSNIYDLFNTILSNNVTALQINDQIESFYINSPYRYIMLNSENKLRSTQFKFILIPEKLNLQTDIYTKIEEIYNEELTSHINQYHNTSSLITIINNKASNKLNDLNMLSVNENENEISNDTIDSIQFSDSTKYPVISCYYSNFTNDFEQTYIQDISYIIKNYKSGLKEIYIYVPTTNTYYINHIIGNIDCNVNHFVSERDNFKNNPELSGKQISGDIYSGRTELIVDINSNFINFNEVFNVNINGNSLPLDVYIDINETCKTSEQYYHSYILPTRGFKYNNKLCDTSDIIKSFNFSIFGSDAQAIKILVKGNN